MELEWTGYSHVITDHATESHLAFGADEMRSECNIVSNSSDGLPYRCGI